MWNRTSDLPHRRHRTPPFNQSRLRPSILTPGHCQIISILLLSENISESTLSPFAFWLAGGLLVSAHLPPDYKATHCVLIIATVPCVGHETRERTASVSLCHAVDNTSSAGITRLLSRGFLVAQEHSLHRQRIRYLGKRSHPKGHEFEVEVTDYSGRGESGTGLLVWTVGFLYRTICSCGPQSTLCGSSENIRAEGSGATPTGSSGTSRAFAVRKIGDKKRICLKRQCHSWD